MAKVKKTTAHYKDSRATIKEKLDLLRDKIEAQRNKIISKDVQKSLKNKTLIHQVDVIKFHPEGILDPGMRLFGEYDEYYNILTKRINGEWLVKQLVKLHAQTIDPKSIMYFGSIDIQADLLGPEHRNPGDLWDKSLSHFNPYTGESWDNYYNPYNHPGLKITILTLPGINTFYKKITNLEVDPLSSRLSNGTDSSYLSELIAKDLFLEPEQVVIDFKQRTIGDALKRKADIKMKSIKKDFRYLKRNIDPDKLSKKDWLSLKETIVEEYVDLIKEFEGIEQAESFQNMLKMFNEYNVKVEKKEAHKDEPRKDK